MLLIAWFVKSEKMKNTRGDAYVSPGLLRHSKTPLELNHTADDIPGFHEVECFLNGGVRLVCKSCKQTTKKPRGNSLSPRGSLVTLKRV